MTRVLVSGSRSWRKNDLVKARMIELDKQLPGPITLVVGEARGVDTVAAQVAKRLGWKVEVHKADWKNKGRGAGMIRNQEMVLSRPHLGLFFIRKNSPGASGCLKLAMRFGVPAWVWRDD